MAQLTFSEAAAQVGVTRQTIYKYVSQGRLSATLAHNGQKQIEVTELLRVFGRLQSPDSANGDTVNTRRMSTKPQATDVVVLELERAKMQVQARDTELALMRERVEELKQREQEAKAQARDAVEQQNRLMGIVEMQGRLLAAPVPATKASPSPTKRTTATALKKAPARPKATPAKKAAPRATPTPAPKKLATARKPITKTPAKPAAKKQATKAPAKTTRAPAKPVKKASRR